MSSPYYFVIKGSFILKYCEPDGGSIRFIADNLNLYQNLHRSYNIKPSRKDGSVQLKFEAVAAPDIHYGTAAQQFGDKARDSLLAWMGFKNIRFFPKNSNIEYFDTRVQSADPDTVHGAILSKAADIDGRPISYVLLERDAASLEDGDWVKVDVVLLEKTMNYRSLDAGIGYYTVYTSTPFIHRQILREVTLQARYANRGVWELDATTEFLLKNQDSIGPKGQLILPKLFHRCTDYLKDVAKGYRGNLSDWLILVSKESRYENDEVVFHNNLKVHLSEVIYHHRYKIVFKADLFDIMFVEK